MPLDWTSYDSGVRTLHASNEPPDAVAAAIAGAAEAQSVVLVFSSDRAIDPAGLAALVAERAPGTRLAGCSSAGEMAPGIEEGSLLAIFFPADRFAVSTLAIDGITSRPMNEIAEAVSDLRRRHGDVHGARCGADFAICLIDGLSYAEEMVTSAVFWGLGNIPLAGGSAGDSLNFVRTLVIAEGTAKPDRAVVLLVRTELPFRVFKSDNFVPVDQRFVVTASDSDRRLVTELNGRPAAEEYAAAVGRSIDAMTARGFASNPLVVRVGGEHYCRAIRGVTEDGALAFACAIDDGVVLMLAEARGMVEATRTRLESIDTELDGIDFVLGFDCAYRRIDARNRQVIRKMSDLYRRYNVVGFGTYGEQYQSMHLNQTLTGIAFARPRRLAAAAE